MNKSALDHHADPPNPIVYLSPQYIQAKEYLEAIVASTSDAICTTDLRGRIIYFSPGAEKLFGRSFRHALGTPVSGLYEGGPEEAERVMKRLLQSGSIADHETVILGTDGRRIHISLSASLLRDRSGRIIGTLGISKDISRRVELEKRLKELSLTDGLTGLQNRRSFEERFPIEVGRAKRQRQKLCLALLDLDRFKQANDRWGHLEGDRILKETAQILSLSIRRDVDSAFRYGGDEFVLLLPGLGLQSACKVLGRVQAGFGKKPFAKLIGLSSGLASLKAPEGAAEFLARADALMYRAKNRKRRR